MIPIFTAPSHAELILSGRKTGIVKKRNSKSFLSNDLTLVTKKNGIAYALGKIKLEKPKILDVGKFTDFQKDHLISDQEKKTWFPGSKKFYFYKIKDFQKFSSPQIVQLKPGVQSIQNMYENELKNYETTNMSKNALVDDWRIVSNWFSLDKQGKQTHKKDMILNVASKIIHEFSRRGVCLAGSNLSKELIFKAKNIHNFTQATDFERDCRLSGKEDKIYLFRPFFQEKQAGEIYDLDSLVEIVEELW